MHTLNKVGKKYPGNQFKVANSLFLILLSLKKVNFCHRCELITAQNEEYEDFRESSIHNRSKQHKNSLISSNY